MLRIGTSGWTYKHWQELFYPPHLPQSKWLTYYTGFFNTVEINTTFYHIPTASTAASWRQKTPSDFLFSIKISRLVTHVYRLKNCEPVLSRFFHELVPLKNKIGAFLFQFPPTFCPSLESLRSFINLLPPENIYVFEFRHEACYDASIIRLLTQKSISFCVHDYPQRASPLVVTAKLIYIRLHGYRTGYKGSYPDKVLQVWAKQIENFLNAGHDILIYFNNDLLGFAVQNALLLKNLLT